MKFLNLFGRIGTSFVVSFLQPGTSLKNALGFERERVTSVCETTYVHVLTSPALISYTGRLDQIEVSC